MGKLVCVLIGYLLGCWNPAARLGKKKQVDLRQEGTKNLGASNVTLVLGKKYGFMVMVLDIFKAFLASRLARALFPKLALSGLLAGFGAVVGHVYPFHMKFRGGKGLAAFGGMVLAHDPMMFLMLLILTFVVMLIVDHSYIMPISAGFLFPVLAGIRSWNLGIFLVAAAAGALVVVKHWSNIAKAKEGRERGMRETFKELLFGNR